MANTLRIKRRLSTGAAGAPTGLLEGELAVNFADSNLYIQGDNGILTMPDKVYVDTAITSATGSLGTMSTQDADSVAITGGAIDGTTIGATTPSPGSFTTLSASDTINGTYLNLSDAGFSSEYAGNGITVSDQNAFLIYTGDTTTGDSVELNIAPTGVSIIGGKLSVDTAPVSGDDVVRKTELDAVSSAVSALGSAFNYVGTVAGGADAGSATDLSALTEKDAGDYYKVATAGYFVLAPASAFYANANDGIVFNNASGVDLIDNTNSNVAGTANEISVTGSADSGFVVAIDSAFSGRLSTAESDITDLDTKTQNINLANTSVGTTQVDGVVNVVGSVGFVGINENEILADGLTSAFTIGTANGDPVNNNLVVTSNAGSSPMTLQATAVNVSGNLVGSGTSTLDGFVLDGGSF